MLLEHSIRTDLQAEETSRLIKHFAFCIPSQKNCSRDMLRSPKYCIYIKKKDTTSNLEIIENKLTVSISKSKYLWNVLKSLGLSNKISSRKVKALKINNAVNNDVNSVLEDFKIIIQCWWRTSYKCSANRPINTLSTLLLNIMNILPKLIILICQF